MLVSLIRASLIGVVFFWCGFQGKRLDGQSLSSVNSWQEVRDQRQEDLQQYLRDKQIAYRWFADFPFGTDDGIPYLILRTLPILAPENWGDGDDFLKVVGLFHDSRQPDYPLPRGVGWSGLGRKADDLRPDYASFGCGACHVGRLRKDDGTIVYLDGGINSEFNLVAYRVGVKKTMDKVTGDAESMHDKIAAAKSAIFKAIDQLHAEDPNFFYGDYVFGQRFDDEYEAKQIQIFKDNADALISKFLVRMNLEVSSLLELINKNYKGFESQMQHGFGGMADATGVSTSFGFVVARDVRKDPNANAATRLPPTPGLTDFMAVWEQGKRQVRWNEDKTQLVDGGGQWNGNIPLPIYRNLAAEMTMGFGEKTDVRIAAFSQDLLVDLPAPPYPFDVDLPLARKGEQLFQQNCADCHRPHNGQIYSNMGTDLGRAKVVSNETAAGASGGFTAIGPPDRIVELPPTGTLVKPFREFQGVSLQDKAHVVMRDPADCMGYNALPLGGIWAQAPYLHTGSIPTLFHLLVPEKRPTQFIKSRLEYDPKLVGFRWTKAEKREIQRVTHLIHLVSRAYTIVDTTKTFLSMERLIRSIGRTTKTAQWLWSNT